MPRLGGDEESNRRVTAAYSNATSYRGPGGYAISFLSLFVGFMILRNLLFHDYRNDVVSELRAQGKTQQEIERIVPKTFEERKQYVEDQKNDLVKMKQDIAYLLQEVDTLKKALNNTK